LRNGPSWCSNPRVRLRCECGSGRPAFWLVEARGQNLQVCANCMRDVWLEELDLWEQALKEARAEEGVA
jgi:hypothetical protein